MMMLLVLVSVLGYDLKTAVGTSVFIMTFTALTGALSHFAISGTIQWFPLISSVFFTYLGAMIAARFANKAEPKKAQSGHRRRPVYSGRIHVGDQISWLNSYKTLRFVRSVFNLRFTFFCHP